MSRISRIIGISPDTVRRQYVEKPRKRLSEGTPPSAESLEQIRRERVSDLLLRHHG